MTASDSLIHAGARARPIRIYFPFLGYPIDVTGCRIGSRGYRTGAKTLKKKALNIGNGTTYKCSLFLSGPNGPVTSSQRRPQPSSAIIS